MAESPLAGVTVVVTRPEQQAAELVDLLEARGARVVTVPLIEIVPLDCAADIAEGLGALTADDWVVVTTANAAASLGATVAKVAAIGPATATQLRRVDLVPSRSIAAALVEEMPAGTGRVLVLQAQGGAPTLVDGLTRKGWTVRRIDTHVSRPLVPNAGEQLRLLEADAVLFTSGSQARAWAELLGSATPPVVVAIGPQTADDARRAGLGVTVVAADHSLAGVVAALERALAG